MAYPRSHLLVTLIGSITSGATVDEWQTSVRIGYHQTVPLHDSSARQLILDDVGADIGTWWTGMRGLYASSVTLDRWKCNQVDVNGHYVSQTETFGGEIAAASRAGGGGGQTLPAQLATVVTLETAVSRGLASKGRMYLPAPIAGALAATDGRIDETERAHIQSTTATLLTNLGNWPGVDALLAPTEPIIASKVLAGAERPVVAVNVGNRFDVQRRRANRLTEVRPASTAV